MNELTQLDVLEQMLGGPKTPDPLVIMNLGEVAVQSGLTATEIMVQTMEYQASQAGPNIKLPLSAVTTQYLRSETLRLTGASPPIVSREVVGAELGYDLGDLEAVIELPKTMAHMEPVSSTMAIYVFRKMPEYGGRHRWPETSFSFASDAQLLELKNATTKLAGSTALAGMLHLAEGEQQKIGRGTTSWLPTFGSLVDKRTDAVSAEHVTVSCRPGSGTLAIADTSRHGTSVLVSHPF